MSQERLISWRKLRTVVLRGLFAALPLFALYTWRAELGSEVLSWEGAFSLVSFLLVFTGAILPFTLCELHARQREEPNQGKPTTLGVIACLVFVAVFVPLVSMQLAYTATVLETGSVKEGFEAIQWVLENIREEPASWGLGIGVLFCVLLAATVIHLRLLRGGTLLFVTLVTFPFSSILFAVYFVVDRVEGQFWPSPDTSPDEQLDQ